MLEFSLEFPLFDLLVSTLPLRSQCVRWDRRMGLSPTFAVFLDTQVGDLKRPFKTSHIARFGIDFHVSLAKGRNFLSA